METSIHPRSPPKGEDGDVYEYENVKGCYCLP